MHKIAMKTGGLHVPVPAKMFTNKELKPKSPTRTEL